MFLQEGDNEPNKIKASFSLCNEYIKVVEPSGRAFEKLVMQVYRNKNEEANENESDNIIEEDTAEYYWGKKN